MLGNVVGRVDHDRVDDVCGVPVVPTVASLAQEEGCVMLVLQASQLVDVVCVVGAEVSVLLVRVHWSCQVCEADGEPHLRHVSIRRVALLGVEGPPVCYLV